MLWQAENELTCPDLEPDDRPTNNITEEEEFEPLTIEFLSDEEYEDEIIENNTKDNEMFLDIESDFPCRDPEFDKEPTINTTEQEELKSSNNDFSSDEEHEDELVEMDTDDNASLSDSSYSCRQHNTNRDMHCKNPLYQTQCQLCNKSDRFLTQHYMKHHPDHEVLLARPSPSMAQRLRSKIDTIKVNTKKQLVAFCYFCEEVRNLARIGWAGHILSHTGEVRYACSGCNAEFASKKHHNYEACSKQPIDIYTKNASDGSLVGFMCNECNYFQINRERVIRHLENEHGFIKTKENHHFGKHILVPGNMHLDEKSKKFNPIFKKLIVMNISKNLFF